MSETSPLIPLTSLLSKDSDNWTFLKSFLTSDKQFYVHNDLQTVRTHINNLDLSYYNMLCSFCLPEKAIFDCSGVERELFIQKNETDEAHFERLKQIYINKYGVLYEIDYLNNYLELNYEILYKKLIKQNLGFIPANTESIFSIKDLFSFSGVKFYGSNKEKIELNQIFVKSAEDKKIIETIKEKNINTEWKLHDRFTGLTGPNVEIVNRSLESTKMLEAIIKLNAKYDGGLIKQNEFFDFADSDSYERKMSQFTRNYKCYKKILRYDNKRKAYKVLIPPDWCKQFS